MLRGYTISISPAGLFPCRSRVVALLCLTGRQGIARLRGVRSRTLYPDTLRLIGYVDSQTHRRLVFLTNNLTLAPLTIALLYRKRWQIELFFKWVKQHLHIKAFFGTTINAVQTSRWPRMVFIQPQRASQVIRFSIIWRRVWCGCPDQLVTCDLFLAISLAGVLECHARLIGKALR